MIGRFRLLALCTVISTVLHSTWEVKGAPFSGGIVVERIGGDASFGGPGSATPSGTAASIFLDEFSLSSGSRIQTIALPDTDPDGAGAQHRITENGNQNQTGYLSRTADNKYLVVDGVDYAVGTTAFPGTVNAPSLNYRIVARVDGSGTVDTSTGYSHDGIAGGNATPRGVASGDGTSFYISTANTTSASRYIDQFGAIDSATVAVGGQARAVGIFDNHFWYNNVTGNAFVSVKDSTTGGLPTSNATATSTSVAGIQNGDPQQFVLLDLVPGVGFDGTTLDTIYLTHSGTIDSTTANPSPTAGGNMNSGGLQKYTFDGSAWTQQITFNSGLSSNPADSMFGGLEGLVSAGFDSSNNPILYATTAASFTRLNSTATNNALVKIIDSGPNSAFVKVTDAPTNTNFRGVALAPVSAGVVGDYNSNGIVDAADYVLWRQNPGAHGGDPAGYNTWRAHFGNTSGSGSLAATAVPEPATFALVGLAVPALLVGRGRRFTQSNV